MISSIWTYLAGFWKANAGTASAAADRAPLDHQEQHAPVVEAAREVFAGSATIAPAAPPSVSSAADTEPILAVRRPPTYPPAAVVRTPLPPPARTWAGPRPVDWVVHGDPEDLVIDQLAQAAAELGSPLAAAQYLFHPREDRS